MNNLYMCKARTIEAGNWVIGYVVFPNDPLLGLEAIIIPNKCDIAVNADERRLRFDQWYTVDKNTICRATDFSDVNGRDVWEHDIVRCVYDGDEYIYEVCWDPDELGFKATNGSECYCNSFQYLPCCEEVEVIGNVFENPELLTSRMISDAF